MKSNMDSYEITPLSKIGEYLRLNDSDPFFVNISEESLSRMHDLLVNKKEFEPITKEEYVVWLCYHRQDEDAFIEYFKRAIILEYDLEVLFFCLGKQLNAQWQPGFIWDIRPNEKFVNRLYDLTINFFEDEIEKGNVMAIYVLGLIYYIKDDKTNAGKYYELAIEKKYIPAILRYYGIYWMDESKKDSINRYLKLGIKLGSIDCIVSLALYYWNQLNDYEETLKLYTYAFEKYPNDREKIFGDITVHMHYKIAFKFKKDYMRLCVQFHHYSPSLIRYLADMLHSNKILDAEIIECILKLDLSQFDKKDIPASIRLIHKIYKEKIDFIALHYAYQPGEAGFQEAKIDFDKRIINHGT